MLRLFSGIKIPSSITQWLLTLQSGIKNAHWIEPENHHITLRFIGNVDPQTAIDYSLMLDQIKFQPFTLKLQGVGHFGNKKPRCLWAGVKPNEGLMALQQQHEKAAVAVGLAPEQRHYKPHATLLRSAQLTKGQVEQYQFIHGLFESPSFEVKDFQLFSARSGYGGGPYLIEGTYPEGCAVEECNILAKKYL